MCVIRPRATVAATLSLHSRVQHSWMGVDGSVASTAASSRGQRANTTQHAQHTLRHRQARERARLHRQRHSPAGPSQPRTISASTPNAASTGSASLAARNAVLPSRRNQTIEPVERLVNMPALHPSLSCTLPILMPSLMQALLQPSQAHATNGCRRQYKHSH